MPAFNSFPYNYNIYNGSLSNVEILSTDIVVFDGFSISDGTAMIVQELIESEPTREILGGPVPRDDGLYTIADYWREKEITVSGIITRDTKQALDNYLDTIRQNLRTREANLDITRLNDDGTINYVRRYIATLKNPEALFADRAGWNITICPFTAVFTCRTPFAKSRDYTSATDTLTSSPTTLTATPTGTYKSKMVVTLTFNSASSVTSVNINNQTTSEQIAYSGAISAADILEFDSELKTVTKNSVLVDYTGIFPNLELGENSILFTINGTFNITCTIKYKNTYL